MNAIETSGLTKRFGDILAVDDLSLTVEEGEVFGFLGPNGAGKSTTINLLLGFADPTAGSARIFDHDVTEAQTEIKQRLGLLPEGLAGYENLSAREHVVSAIETKGVDDDPDELIERVGLDETDARRPVSEYSTGMYRRMALAVALVGDPDLLILDEPSTGLDPNGVRRLRRIVREERDRGATVFFSSHVLAEVETVSDRVGIMQSGELVAVDTLEKLRADLEVDTVLEATVEGEPDSGALDALDGVGEVTVTGNTVRVTCAESGAKMEAIETLETTVEVRDIDIRDASLETLFEEVTRNESTRARGNETPASDRSAGTAGGDRQ